MIIPLSPSPRISRTWKMKIIKAHKRDSFVRIFLLVFSAWKIFQLEIFLVIFFSSHNDTEFSIVEQIFFQVRDVLDYFLNGNFNFSDMKKTGKSIKKIVQTVRVKKRSGEVGKAILDGKVIRKVGGGFDALLRGDDGRLMNEWAVKLKKNVWKLSKLSKVWFENKFKCLAKKSGFKVIS